MPFLQHFRDVFCVLELFFWCFCGVFVAFRSCFCVFEVFLCLFCDIFVTFSCVLEPFFWCFCGVLVAFRGLFVAFSWHCRGFSSCFSVFLVKSGAFVEGLLQGAQSTSFVAKSRWKRAFLEGNGELPLSSNPPSRLSGLDSNLLEGFLGVLEPRRPPSRS